MFKKFYLLFLILLNVTLIGESRANFWDDLKNCFTNPCNCGFGKRIEEWNGRLIDQGDLNPLCPPWNKDGGRDNHTCLINTPYPDIFVPWHMTHCAESTKESSYFNPKIRIRNQSCNAVACWTMTETLKWDGQCVVWPTGYAFPLLRICARVAVPANPKTNTPDDPGYTKGKHLNFEGFEEDDEIIIGVDGQPIDFNKPKLCAYRDPSFADSTVSLGITLDGIDIPDLMDFNPVSQPLHKTKEPHIIGKIIVFFIDRAEEAGQGLTQLLSSLFDLIGNAVVPNLDLFKPVFEVLGAIIQKFFEVLKDEILKYTQLNRLVSDYKFGCVEIPLGPYPPPFCPKLKPYSPPATVQTVCDTAVNGVIVNSTASDLCVVSKLRNNFIHNTVRVTYDNFVPRCKGSEDPQKTDKCVVLENLTLLESAQAIHQLTERRDYIKPCSSVSNGAPCVNTRIPFSCSVGLNGCEDGFRIVYAEKISHTSMPSNYFRDDLNDCSSANTKLNCQEIWGINTGEFRDVELQFPEIDFATNIADLATSFALKDLSKSDHNFNASIVRKERYDSATDLQRQSNQICVFENNEVIGCVARAEATKPVVYDCDAELEGLPTCTTGYFAPRFIISMRTNNDIDTTSAVIEPLSVNNSNTANYLVNLAGYDFNSFVTDDTFVERPFEGPKAYGATTLFGTYKNNAVPFNKTTRTSTNAVYLYGLEYANDKYVQGGKWACARYETSQHCPLNEKNCVLTNLVNRDLISCNTFFNKAKTYANMRLCSPTDSGCVGVDFIAGKTGGPGITIMQCGGNSGYYCYTNASDTEVCKISQKPTDRYIPLPDTDPNSITMLPDSQYYTSGLQQDYDGNLYALRDKISVERGLCVKIPQPICPAIDAPLPDDGNATWPETKLGEQATGTCIPGTYPISLVKPLKRYCLSNAITAKVDFDVLDADVGCAFPTIKLLGETNNLPSYPKNIYQTGKTGGIELGTLTPLGIAFNNTYYSNLTYEVSDLNAVASFKLTTLSFKDYVIVSVNGQEAYKGPGTFNNIINIITQPATALRTDISDIDLKPYLQQGNNIIMIELGTIFNGVLYYKLDYTEN